MIFSKKKYDIPKKKIKRYMCNVDKKNENGISNTWQTRQKDKSTKDYIENLILGKANKPHQKPTG